MWKFLRKIFSEKEGEVTVVVLDETDPNSSSTFKLKSFDVIKIAAIVAVISIVLSIGIFFVTPLSSIYQDQVDEQFRDQVIAINQRVEALQDSLYAREVQLNDLKQFIRTVPDTNFAANRSFTGEEEVGQGSSWSDPVMVPTFEMLNQNEIISSSRLAGAPDFPSFYPIEGSLTQNFSSEEEHYGIDLAANRNTEFRSIADGTVVNTGWTINYGYVIYVQHSNGIMSVYKHGAKLLKEQGDVVLKGDLLGLIGNSGVLSSGSHLHLEIWKNGVPQNPLMYLME
ncbi:M23 family metallopeptidase [Rhodohalobacter sulfatireducens]|uniref:M23 family metallopeptidase n=1 Tax=Rhodohalobacter sulfatireducens TaxID=2911366 RepID=A0ABS9KI14_9BACT|nr:M23 family metallopeptidase [Rhodohalobacter sulfatireducens]MCG2590492.1 M23 family metallopeptidase [Rhodohalobacter sulfatireducens]